MKPNDIKRTLLAYFFLTSLTMLEAKLTSEQSESEEGPFGRNRTTTYYRDGEMIYQRKENRFQPDGTYQESIEIFYINGSQVLMTGDLGGVRNTTIESKDGITVSTLSPVNSWTPFSINIESEDGNLEIFDRKNDGFYYPKTDLEIKQAKEASVKLDVHMKSLLSNPN